MKKLIVTVDGKPFEVIVEEIQPGGTSAPAPVPSASAAPLAAAPAPQATPAKPAPAASAGDVPCPLAGRVVSVDCAVGQSVAEGDKLLTLEAMKMHTIVSAGSAGTVSAIHVNAGDSVEEGQALLTIS